MSSNENIGLGAIALLVIVFFGYIIMSSNTREENIKDTFFYYQNKDLYVDQCGEFFIGQKEFADKDDRVNELCNNFADVLNKINKDLYFDDKVEVPSTKTPSPIGTSYE